ncbi:MULTISPECIES: 3-methyl-2-oxobutanoate hydroxymethyltransferase [Gulbenkiania]|uniref:3-methyl-2-oxobutanoate hydroxymethyltransferase n=2 Tax=Gulbenkiania TaxID=397456 RepID=A0A0K6H4X3_9NEIS|nr:MULTISPECIES: 3-methyl-2-oxobutanoate hydroxymethyltransferase [Gulbenkiania]TCW30350.1 3-methyl-2-oxobutanoate hydroxymethyltransferase [Gulbenkiania mobilis]CUA85775.1 3-methyl-2-oxobutanoate hydroxymethyltransferase [Gulbenkiania indica]
MRTTVNTLQKMAAEGQKISMLTCYDASFAALLDEAGVDILLIGDSLGMVVQSHDSTLPVTLDEMVYHTRCVARGASRALVLADLPFGAYQESLAQAFASSARLMQAGAHMVKLEGGGFMADTVRFLVERGIPVCAHIGLTPQFVNAFGGYRVQGKSATDAERILEDAQRLADAGASLVLMECVPADLARRVTETLSVPTIGIGAGPDVSGQVLVLHDMLGVYPGKKARFVKNFMNGAPSIQAAVKAYVESVKNGTFPTAEHCF